MATELILANISYPIQYINQTANQTIINVIEKQDTFTAILSAPWFWGVMGILIVCVTLIMLKGKKTKPEEDPFYGIKLRKKVTTNEIQKRNDIFGIKVKWKAYKGFLYMGKCFKIEPITRILADKKGNKKEIDYYSLSIMGSGIWAWIKANLLHQYQHILLDPATCKIDTKKGTININPKAFFVDDSGVWTMATNKEMEFIDELNVKKDVENVKGFTTSFVQKISNLNPSVASENERSTHVSDLEEKQKKNRISRFVGG